jgi:hypothetical protein
MEGLFFCGQGRNLPSGKLEQALPGGAHHGHQMFSLVGVSTKLCHYIARVTVMQAAKALPEVGTSDFGGGHVRGLLYGQALTHNNFIASASHRPLRASFSVIHILYYWPKQSLVSYWIRQWSKRSPRTLLCYTDHERLLQHGPIHQSAPRDVDRHYPPLDQCRSRPETRFYFIQGKSMRTAGHHCPRAARSAVAGRAPDLLRLEPHREKLKTPSIHGLTQDSTLSAVCHHQPSPHHP